MQADFIPSTCMAIKRLFLEEFSMWFMVEVKGVRRFMALSERNDHGKTICFRWLKALRLMEKDYGFVKEYPNPTRKTDLQG
jgi:hypothetical protein